MEGEYYLGGLETLKESIEKMKERYINTLSDRNHLLEMTDIYHHTLRKEEDEAKRIGRKLEAAYGSLEGTQRYLKESNLYTYQLQNDLIMSHLSCCMEGNVLGIVEEFPMEDGHAKSSYLQVLVKEDTIEYID